MSLKSFLFNHVVILSLIFSATGLYADEVKPVSTPTQALELPKPKSTGHIVHIDGKEISYTSTVGYQTIYSDDGKPQAYLFYIAYKKTPLETDGKRPVTFFFGGGPGASSAWLNMGGFGPKRVNLPDLQFPVPPYSYSENPNCMLDISDLVFVDPMSTGFSKPAQGIEPKTFYNAKDDVRVLSEFVRLYVTVNDLWDAPKFLAGESYGAYRITRMASYLHNEVYLYLNGLVFLSPVLNYQTIQDDDDSNDLPYPLILPTYAATNAYYKKQQDLEGILNKAEAFANNAYNQALFQGDLLKPEVKEEIAKELAAITGLSKEYILRGRLRIRSDAFSKELLKGHNLSVGLCDSRIYGVTVAGGKPIFGCSEPSAEAYLGSFAAAINSYLNEELDWKTHETYNIFANTCPWDFGANNNQYPYAGEKLRDVMSQNPRLKVFSGSGLYDLITPYYSVKYTLDHLRLDPSLSSHVTEKRYLSGHMLYLDSKAAKEIKNDLSQFYKDAQKQ